MPQPNFVPVMPSTWRSTDRSGVSLPTSTGYEFNGEAHDEFTPFMLAFSVRGPLLLPVMIPPRSMRFRRAARFRRRCAMMTASAKQTPSAA
jgi:hypothetical protein